jgi:hypothetical protein
MGLEFMQFLSHFFPTFDKAYLGFSRCPFPYEVVSFSEGKWPFEPPVATVSLAVARTQSLEVGIPL